MDALGAVGGLLVLVALSFGLMQAALWRRRGGGLFSALPMGLLPAFIFVASQFLALQQTELPEIKAVRAGWAEVAKEASAKVAPGPDQAQTRADFEALWAEVAEAYPAFLFVLIMAMLAPLAAYLRRRQARHGFAPDPGPLGRWSVPWPMVWLVLAPLFWMAGVRNGAVTGPAWADHLALNVLLLGTVIFLFQGLIVVGAKFSAWSRNPRTRGLAFLSLAGLFFALFFADLASLLQMASVMLLLMGLFEPWVDLRHLKAPTPHDGGAGAGQSTK